MPPLPERLVVLKLFRQSREGNCISVFYRELKRFKKCELLILSGFILMLLCVSGVLTVLHLCMCVSTSAWALAWEHICCVYIWGSDRRVRYVLGEIVYGCACFGVGTTEQFGIGKDFVCLQQLQKENEMKIHLLLCCQKHIEKEHPGWVKGVKMFRPSQWSYFLPLTFSPPCIMCLNLIWRLRS